MENEINFDALARKAMQSGGAAEDIENLSKQIFALPKWHFIARGEFPEVNPYVASNADYADGQPMIRAFTDTNRLQRFAKENNLTKADGSTLMLDIPIDEIVDYLEKFIAHGVHGIWFNSDSGSEGFFFPLAQLRPIKEQLEKMNSETANSASPNRYSNLENWGLKHLPDDSIDLNLKIAEKDKESSANQSDSPNARQSAAIPNKRIEVRYKRIPDAALGVLTVFFGGISLLLLLSSGARPLQSLVAFFCLSVLFVVWFLALRAKRKAVRSFDESGIARGDGRRFSWNEFQGVVRREGRGRYGRKYIWRVELVFTSGQKAWLIPQRIKNFEEVFSFVDALPKAALKD